MSIMIPTSISKLPGTTAGERKLFSIFQQLSDSCIVRYEMIIGERDFRPDYIIVDPERGLLIIEVKDWGLSSIEKASREQFFIRGMGGSYFAKPVRNPDQKCKTYLRHTREQLAAMPGLRDPKSDRLTVPVQYFVAFPNLGRQEFMADGYNQLIPLENVLFKEDLLANGKPFLARYRSDIPKLEKPLGDQQLKDITSALFPDLSIKIGSRLVKAETANVNLDSDLFETFSLSVEQEQIAKSLGEGPRLLRGIAGTGKTLIMLYRAKLLAANDPEGKLRILVLCWNVSLANYMRQAFDTLNLPPGRGQVVIKHFAEFCKDVLGQGGHNFDDPSLIDRFNARFISQREKYDAIYIDEAQDFRREWIEFLFHSMLKQGEPTRRNLLIAADDAQRIYPNRNFSWTELESGTDNKRLYGSGRVTWSQMGIPMRGRSKILKTVYRNSARVWVFSAFLLGDEASYVKEQADRVRFSNKGGFDPQLTEMVTPAKQIEKAVEIIQRVVKSGYASRNILVLYRHQRSSNFRWVDALKVQFKKHSIPFDWISEDKAKRTFHWKNDTVKLSTVHSAKGMDSPIVIIVGAEEFQDGQGSVDETKLMYVALTRAREYLEVLHSGTSGLVPQLQECQRKYLANRDTIIGLETMA